MAVHLFLLLPHVRLAENSERCDGCLYSDVDERNADCLNTSISELSLLEEYMAAERDLKTYYDGFVLKELSEYLEAFNPEFPQVQTDLLMHLLVYPSNLCSADWWDDRNSDENFIVYINNRTIKNDILSEVCSRVGKFVLPQPLLVNISAIDGNVLYCQSITTPDKPEKGFKLDITPMCASDVIVSMESVRYPRREYSHNIKHDRTDGYASKLQCTRPKAAHMLHVGVGKESWLIWAYDDETDTFMAYRCEDKNDAGIKWHAYTPSPHDDVRRKNMREDFLSFIKDVALKYKSQESNHGIQD